MPRATPPEPAATTAAIETDARAHAWRVALARGLLRERRILGERRYYAESQARPVEVVMRASLAGEETLRFEWSRRELGWAGPLHELSFLLDRRGRLLQAEHRITQRNELSWHGVVARKGGQLQVRERFGDERLSATVLPWSDDVLLDHLAAYLWPALADLLPLELLGAPLCPWRSYPASEPHPVLETQLVGPGAWVCRFRASSGSAPQRLEVADGVLQSFTLRGRGLPHDRPLRDSDQPLLRFRLLRPEELTPAAGYQRELEASVMRAMARAVADLDQRDTFSGLTLPAPSGYELLLVRPDAEGPDWALVATPHDPNSAGRSFVALPVGPLYAAPARVPLASDPNQLLTTPGIEPVR